MTQTVQVFTTNIHYSTMLCIDQFIPARNTTKDDFSGSMYRIIYSCIQRLRIFFVLLTRTLSHAALLFFLFFLNGAMKGLSLSVNKSSPFKSNNQFLFLFPEEHLFSIPSLLLLHLLIVFSCVSYFSRNIPF